MAQSNSGTSSSGVPRILAAAAILVVAAMSGHAIAQSGMFEYVTCRDRKADFDARIFACSRVIGDTAQPADIRSLALHRRGEAYWVKNNEDQVLADFTEAIRLNPKSDEAYGSRGLLYQHKKDYNRAIADLTQVVRLAPGFESYMNRAFAYQAKGDYDRALADYDEVLRLGGAKSFGNYGLYTARGDTYKAKGDMERAIADYRKALEFAPNDAVKAAVEEALKSLGAN